MFDKTFNPKEHEARLYQKTEHLFQSQIDRDKKPFVIMMPPPNVTGSLHLGHAFNDTLQDILIRYHQKKGYDVLWQPGTDHAGIATQIVVERQLKEQGITRYDLGREKFLEKVWEWREQSGYTILNQKRRLCIAADWTRQRFTMDEGLSKAVVKVFVDLYKAGLIFKDKRLVNWDTQLQTALSDLEVVNREEQGKLWYIAYAVEGETEPLIVATTRPETLFADSAVAIHPSDTRFKHLIGRWAIIPISHRKIPIIADEYCDLEKGSGIVKITPGHDMNDFEVGKRHNLPLLNMMDVSGRLVSPAPEAYLGLTFDQARQKVLGELETLGHLIKTETILHSVPYSERTGVVIQPYLTDQWYLNAKELAKPAIEAVEQKRTQFFPHMWENTYFEWLKNIQPWCISRQIWWGHQIPAWYGPDESIFVEENEEKANAVAEQHYGKKVVLRRDEDVLDTWFSSSLWPFTTLGWPNETPELNRYYPSSVLTTGFDIIFFWVARMMMMGLYFMKDVPFKTVYIHALIRDEKGQKMSKSKGNIIDPLTLIDQYGADALRFTLTKLATPGRDIKIGASLVELSRNFVTKIWNAAKFLHAQKIGCEDFSDFFSPIEEKQHIVNEWIIQRTRRMIVEVEQSILTYRFDQAGLHLQQYFWKEYCDVYIECLKTLLKNSDFEKETRQTAIWCFMQFLNVLNLFMPTLSERLFEIFSNKSERTLMEQRWTDQDLEQPTVDLSIMSWILAFIDEIRSLKGLLGITGMAKRSIIATVNSEEWITLKTHFEWISNLAQLDQLKDSASCSIEFVVGGKRLGLEVDDEASKNQMRTILDHKKNVLEGELMQLRKKLDNLAFKEAKPDLWQENHILLEKKESDYEKMVLILEEWR